jgi:hypothetical protein
MMARTPGLQRVGVGEAELAQIETIDEGVDRAHGIVFCDVVVKRRREHRALTAIHPFNEPSHPSPRQFSEAILA